MFCSYYIWPFKCWIRFFLCPFFEEFWSSVSAEFCQRLFPHLLRLSYGFVIQFVNLVYHIDWFAYIEESLHPWNKPSWSLCMNFLMCCWILLLEFCWGFFSFLILLTWSLLPFFNLMSLAKGLSILFIFSKNQLLVLLIFTIISFNSFSIISALIFIISFLLLILGFFCCCSSSSFSSCFRCEVRLSIRYFSCFLG